MSQSRWDLLEALVADEECQPSTSAKTPSKKSPIEVELGRYVNKTLFGRYLIIIWPCFELSLFVF
jgi:hypothetical protein